MFKRVLCLAARAHRIAEQFFAEKNGASQHKLMAVGNCHIDSGQWNTNLFYYVTKEKGIVINASIAAATDFNSLASFRQFLNAADLSQYLSFYW